MTLTVRGPIGRGGGHSPKLLRIDRPPIEMEDSADRAHIAASRQQRRSHWSPN
jgi:hypothetical protein